MDSHTYHPSCACHQSDQEQKKSGSKARLTAKALPSVIMSVLIAFFPKCPICWAVYMSMFGSLGLTRLPYMKWLLPVLIVFLAIHLFFLYRRIKITGYVPFFISVAGAATIICCRMLFPFAQWPLAIGITCIVAGSLLNSFPNLGLYFLQKKQPNLF